MSRRERRLLPGTALIPAALLALLLVAISPGHAAPGNFLIAHRIPADAINMTTFRTTHRTRTASRFPVEHGRAVGVGQLPPGGGAAGGMEAWRLPPAQVWRTVVVCGRVLPRLCTLVRHPAIPDAPA